MRVRVKIFSQPGVTALQKLEDEINAWLDQLPESQEVVNMSTAVGATGSGAVMRTVVTVWYDGAETL